MATGKATAARARMYDDKRREKEQAEVKRYKRLFNKLYIGFRQQHNDDFLAKEITQDAIQCIFSKEMREKQAKREYYQQLARELSDKIEADIVLNNWERYWTSLSGAEQAEIAEQGEELRQTVRETNIEKYGTPW